MTSSQPASMRACLLDVAHGPFVCRHIPRPKPAPGEVLVRVHASGVNPLDTKIRAGAAPHARHPLPAVLGMDLAGTVEALGEGVHQFQPGDAVYGFTGGVGGVQGSLAEYVAADVRLLARKPQSLNMRQAAALPLVFITAWEGLVDRAKVQAGQRVLVQGGAGGVGHVAIQLARARGARVYATARIEQFDYLRSIGATPIDSRTTPLDDYVAEHTQGHGFDVLFDTVGGAALDASFLAARRYTGHVVTALGWGTHSLAPLALRGASFSGIFTLLPLLTGEFRSHHGDILREATRLAEQGLLRPQLDPCRPTLDSVASAHALVAGGQASGKVVIDVLA